MIKLEGHTEYVNSSRFQPPEPSLLLGPETGPFSGSGIFLLDACHHVLDAGSEFVLSVCWLGAGAKLVRRNLS